MVWRMDGMVFGWHGGAVDLISELAWLGGVVERNNGGGGTWNGQV